MVSVSRERKPALWSRGEDANNSWLLCLALHPCQLVYPLPQLGIIGIIIIPIIHMKKLRLRDAMQIAVWSDLCGVICD